MGFENESKRYSRSWLEFVLRAIYDEFIEVLVESAEKEQRRGRVIAFQDLQENGYEISFTKFDTWTADYLRNKIYTFSQSTFDALVSDAAESLNQSYEQGLGIDDAARELRQVFQGLRDYRLRLIARTEINSAQNEGAQHTMEEYGV